MSATVDERLCPTCGAGVIIRAVDFKCPDCRTTGCFAGSPTTTPLERRDQLAAILDDTAAGIMLGHHGSGWGRRVADQLLPLVLGIAADELDQAAAVVRQDHGTASLPAKSIDARAAALRTAAS